MSEKQDEKLEFPKDGIGLALGGGLARGFAHIGAINALERHGIRPSFVAGTSIGAVVGACYLAGKLKDFESWALSLTRYKVLGYLDFKVYSGGLIGGRHLINLLTEHLGDIQIEDLPAPFLTIAADLRTGHEIWIRKGSLIEAMQASFALPGVFPPVQKDGRFLVDGALVNPVPVSACQAMSSSRMTIAVDLNADIIGKASEPGKPYQRVTGFDMFDKNEVEPEQQGIFGSFSITRRLFRREENSPSMFGAMVSSLNIIQDRLTRSRLAGEPPDVHIKPHIGHIGLLEFEKAQELIEFGDAAVERNMPKIKAAMDVFLPHSCENNHEKDD